MKASSRPLEQGNVIFYILIAIALLGALSFAVSQSFRGSSNSLTQERARLLSTEIIEYSNALANAVGQLRLRGTMENQLCFDAPEWGHANYDYTPCDDEKNKIFSIHGGGIVWKNVPEEAMIPGSITDNYWRFSATNQIDQIGSTGTANDNIELYALILGLKDEVCRQINDLLGIAKVSDTIPADGEMSGDAFTGNFVYNNFLTPLGSGAEKRLSGKKAGCYYSGADDANIYYRVLLAR